MPAKLSDELVNSVKIAYSRGDSPKEIAMANDISTMTVYDILTKACLREKRVTQEFSEALKIRAEQLCKSGMSYRQIGLDIGIAETTLKRYLKSVNVTGGVDMSFRIVGKLEVRTKELHDLGFTREAISKELVLSSSTVNLWYEKTGLVPNNKNTIKSRKMEGSSDLDESRVENILPTPSFYLTEIYKFVKEKCPDTILNYQDADYSVDVYVPSKKLAIEFKSLEANCDLHENRRTNIDKQKKLEKANIKLFGIFEDEWVYKKDLVKSMIINRLGMSIGKKVRAEDLQIIKCSRNNQYDWFFDQFHLSGHVLSRFAYALTDGETILACMSFRTHPINKMLEIARYAVNHNYIIYGAAAKILKNIEEVGNIVSYSDNRIGFGELYQNLGFKNITETLEPSYFYTDFNKRVFRTACQRINDAEVLKEYPTEKAQALAGLFSPKCFGHDKPLHKMWDYGSKKWMLIRDHENASIVIKEFEEKKEVISGIYKITNKENGKVYIGQTIDIETRLEKHISTLRNGTHHNKKLQSSWDKHEESQFEFELIEKCEGKEYLLEKENMNIEKYNSIDNGFNIRPAVMVSPSVMGKITKTDEKLYYEAVKKNKTTPEEKRARKSELQRQRRESLGEDKIQERRDKDKRKYYEIREGWIKNNV